MRKRIPFLVFITCTFVGALAGYVDRNYPAGILLGLGIGIILMVVLRFALVKQKKQKETSPEEKQED
jgi:F0F1-type ATP synthase assembly protein I